MQPITGIQKTCIYAKIALHVAVKYFYLVKKPKEYFRFLRRAWILLSTFYSHKIMKVGSGYKLHLYLPAYPTPAFFYALESKLIRTPPAPITVVFSMTKACRYKCPHCYQRLDAGKDLPEEKMIETALALQNEGVAMFDIEGGEPFLFFDKLVHLVERLDTRAEIWVNTTGDHATQEWLQQLKQAGLFGVMISIHSPDAKIHDAFTGIDGAFNTACETIKLCHELGISVAINSVLSEEEITEGKLQKLMDLAKSLGVDFVQLIHPKPSGKWLHHTEHMQKEKGFIDMVEKEHIRFNSHTTKTYPALSAQVFEERKAGFACTAGGIDRLYVNAAGEVQPCEFLNISFGNVQEEAFGTIYQRMRKYFAIPCENWLCCTQAEAIADIMEKHGLTQTPIPWEYTKELVEKWERGEPTELYKKLGIYK